ncbi:MAG: endonuclease domain-containing protein [Dehalococcoidia bacterium]|nr:endonuclease domain-containing protein [Dehalococcoidia bacterium]
MSANYRGGSNMVTSLPYCRQLRRDTTHAEAALWRILRNRQLGGAKFRRQHQFGPYILDFFCDEYHLAVEVDGGQHMEDGQVTRDLARTAYLQEKGLGVLRFTNLEVLHSIGSVVEVILEAVGRPSP